ncbi:hypothetical protein CIB84_017619 [Bambusicola thoracicus]|uniref:Uncharacterized protein n=1 Tax=Bambusicola thoracicus TaxID=9083 RepID=A0A2P4S3I6_BAMTH|nr:hypothetical protein CIB84_017619 [Bambusicola thoracicus]
MTTFHVTATMGIRCSSAFLPSCLLALLKMLS